jgi:phosphoribosylformimino-5-aminoimidazole carboxamide ribotide isomerase
VHARGGERAAYAPARSALAPDAPGNAAAIARAIHARYGDGELYVADLDAIGGAPPQLALIRELADIGRALLVDAGVTAVERGRDLIAAGVARVVVGLETLSSFGALAAIAREAGRERTVLSLDLRGGEPVSRADAPPDASPTDLAHLAAAHGAGAVIALDLARVGSGLGPDLALPRALRHALPAGVELIAGGGIRDAADLARLAELGCDAALVGTAVHEGAVAGFGLRAAGRPGDAR